MNRRESPFAALTGAERQIKWLEYQSVKLPYVHGSVDQLEREPEPPAPPVRETTAMKQPEPPVQGSPAPNNPAQPADRAASSPAPSSPAEFQKTRHRQYDAVIAKMKQAELRARQYQSLR